MIRMMNVCLMAAMFLWFYDAMSPILPFGFVVGWIHAAIDNFNAVANAKCVAIGVIKTATFKQNSIHIEGITKVVSLLIGVEMVYHYSIGAFKVIVQFFFFQDSCNQHP